MSAPTAAFAIGEFDQTIFDCPACSRPLALGARRCPGCGTRLVRGVTLGKASLFIALGLVVGLLAGSAGGLVFGLSQAAVAAPRQAATPPSAAPVTGTNGGGRPISTVNVPSPSPGAPTATPIAATPVPVPVPPVTASAFGQVLATNGRLAENRAALKASLNAAVFDASSVAQSLRSISADSIFGQQVAGHLSEWPGSSAVGAQLERFYGAVHDAAAKGLVASVRNQAAYRTAAKAMVKLLDELRAIDTAVRTVAGSAGLDLPVASGQPRAP